MRVTPQIRQEIIADNTLLSGTTYSRAKELSKQHGYSHVTIANIIDPDRTNEVKKSHFEPGEKQNILKEYFESDLEVNAHKLKYLSEKYNRSQDSIRRLVRHGKLDTGVKLFNHTKFYY